MDAQDMTPTQESPPHSKSSTTAATTTTRSSSSMGGNTCSRLETASSSQDGNVGSDHDGDKDEVDDFVFRPAYFFLYGSLMDPDILYRVTRLPPSEYPPILREASLGGYNLKIWAKEYPVLVPIGARERLDSAIDNEDVYAHGGDKPGTGGGVSTSFSEVGGGNIVCRATQLENSVSNATVRDSGIEHLSVRGRTNTNMTTTTMATSYSSAYDYNSDDYTDGNADEDNNNNNSNKGSADGGGLEDGPRIRGRIWLATDMEQALRLQTFETAAYIACDCTVRLEGELSAEGPGDGDGDGDGVGTMIRAVTFVWAGDPEDRDLTEGVFDFAEFQRVDKPRLLGPWRPPSVASRKGMTEAAVVAAVEAES